MVVGHRAIGTGPVRVLFIHGWFSDSSVYDPLLSALDPSIFTCVLIDFRGYGKSANVSGNYTVAEIAADAFEVADSLGWSSFHVVGHSMGGKVGQQMLAAQPARIKKAVLLTPVPASGVPFDDETLSLFQAATHSLEARAGIIGHSAGDRLPKFWSMSLARESVDRSNDQAFASYFRDWSGTDFSNELTGAATPTLVLVGEHDPGLTEDVMKATICCWMPNAKVEVVPNAGHYPMQEVPLLTAARIQAFLSEGRS